MFLLSASVILTFFSARGWQAWDVEHRPLIPEGMPVLIDDDLLFEDGPAAPRPTVVVNRWLRELPASGAPAPSSWETYARVVKEWTEFLAEHGVGLFESRERLKAGLSRYAEHRAAGPVKSRFAATTWGQHMSILSLFYRWAIAEGYAAAEPFTYRAARALFAGTGWEVRVNLAVRRTPKPHVTIKYLEGDFVELFRNGLQGLAPDGSPDSGFAGREMARNAAIGDLALSTGLRLQEFTFLLPWEIPALPPSSTRSRSRSRCRRQSRRAARAHHLDPLRRLGRGARLHQPGTRGARRGSSLAAPRRSGEPLQVSEPDRGAADQRRRRSWAPDPGRAAAAGGTRRWLVLLAVQGDGGPFTGGRPC